MKKKQNKRVGVITFHFVNNFGGVLQTWALVRTIKNKCHRLCDDRL